MAALECTVEVRKEKGVVVTVADPDKGSTQTIELGSDRIVIRVEGKDGTSTLLQTQDGIFVTSKKFQVEADEVDIAATSGAMRLASKGDMTVDSKATLAHSASSEIVAKAPKITSAATSENQVTGGGQAVALKGAGIDIASKAQLGLSGTKTTVEGKAMLELKSGGTLLLKGAMSNIQSTGMTSVK